MNTKIAPFLSTTALVLVITLESHSAPGYQIAGPAPATPGGGQFFYPVQQQAQPPLQPIGTFMAPQQRTAGGLYPAFNYSQPQQQGPLLQQGKVSPLVAQASQIIADWAQNKNKYDKINTKTTSFTKAYQNIDDSLNSLIAAAPYLPPDKQQPALMVRWMLKFIQLKVLLQELNVLKTNMPYLINEVVKNRDEDRTLKIQTLGSDPIGKEWIREKKSTLQRIVGDFTTKLIPSIPNFVNNIPPQLDGFNITYQKAAEMDAYLAQQISCFTNPDPNLCSFKPLPKTKNKNQQNQMGYGNYGNYGRSSLGQDEDEDSVDNNSLDDY